MPRDEAAAIVIAGILLVGAAVLSQPIPVFTQTALHPYQQPTYSFTLSDPETVSELTVTATINHTKFNRVILHLNGDRLLFIDTVGHHTATIPREDLPPLSATNNLTVEVWQGLDTEPATVTALTITAQTRNKERFSQAAVTAAGVFALLWLAANIRRRRK